MRFNDNERSLRPCRPLGTACPRGKGNNRRGKTYCMYIPRGTWEYVHSFTNKKFKIYFDIKINFTVTKI